jgi:zinc protease
LFSGAVVLLPTQEHVKMKSMIFRTLLGLSLSCCSDSCRITVLLAGESQTDIAAASTVVENSTPVTDEKQAVWPHDGSDLPPDPNAFWGHLDNGMRYVILPHRQSPGRASLRLRIDAGSLHEREDQSGVAHFIEHMAFNGTRSLPGEQMVSFFQRLGMSFGAHTNAATGFTETIYRLEVPNTDRVVMGEALHWFRDILDGLTMDEEQVKRERGVILSEATARNSGQFRQTTDSLAFLLPQTSVSKRMPIGDRKVIRNMTSEKLREFHQMWYTPQRALLVVVGDVQADDLQALIAAEFSPIKPGNPPVAPEIGKVSEGGGFRSHLFADPALGSSTITVAIERPLVPVPDSLAAQKKTCIDIFANAMLNERFRSLLEKPGSAILSATAARTEVFGLVDEWALTAQVSPSEWERAIEIMEQELRRAVQFGFSDAEFQKIASQVSSYVRTAAETADSRATSDLADHVLSELGKQHVVTHPRSDAELCERLLKEISAEDCTRVLREICSTEDFNIVLGGASRSSFGFAADQDCNERIRQVWEASRNVSVDPHTDEAESRFAYTDFGVVGEIVEATDVPDLQVTQLRFRNHIRANIKQTTSEDDHVQVVVRFGAGLLEAPASLPGLPKVTQAVFISGGTGAHDFAELNRVLSEKQWRVEFSVAEDAFLFRGQSTTADLNTLLQVITAYISDPGFRPVALEQIHSQLNDIYSFLDHSADGMTQRVLQSAIRGGDFRFGFPSRDEFAAVTMKDVSTWLEAPLKRGYLEVSVVGDIDTENVRGLLAATLGTLPEREVSKKDFTDERRLQSGETNDVKSWKFSSDSTAASATILWPTVDGSDTKLARRMTVLGLILKDRIRLKVREELGATYSPEVESHCSDVFSDFGFIAAQLTVESADVYRISRLVTEIADELAHGSVTDDEFDRAVKPRLDQIKEEMRSNSYWSGVLCRCQEQPDWLDAARSRSDEHNSITRAEIESLARQYLSQDRCRVYTLIPESKTNLR